MIEITKKIDICTISQVVIIIVFFFFKRTASPKVYVLGNALFLVLPQSKLKLETNAPF